MMPLSIFDNNCALDFVTTPGLDNTEDRGLLVHLFAIEPPDKGLNVRGRLSLTVDLHRVPNCTILGNIPLQDHRWTQQCYLQLKLLLASIKPDLNG